MKKDFDAVEMMRSIRDQLQKEYESNPELRKKRLDMIRKKHELNQKLKKETHK
ncbi:hypothetical protein BH23BAC1_BH23BAC1_51210 [soil metagenome]